MCLALDLSLSPQVCSFSFRHPRCTSRPFYYSPLPTLETEEVFVAVYVVQLLCDRTYTKSGRSKTGRIKTRRTTTVRTQPCRRAAERANAWLNNDCFIWHCPCSLLPVYIVCLTNTCNSPLAEWRGFIVIHIVLQRVHGEIFNGFPWGGGYSVLGPPLAFTWGIGRTDSSQATA